MSDAAREFLGQLAAEHTAINAATASPNPTPYRGAEQSRLWRGWQPGNYSGDAAIYRDFRALTPRIRDLFRNEPTLRKLARELKKHVISANGIQTFADVRLQDGALPGEQDLDDAFNFEADEEFERWSEGECDVEGRLSWPEMQWLYFSEIIESGGALLLECWDDSPRRRNPLCYQIVEYDQLDTRYDQPTGRSGNKIMRGIEYDSRNRPVAFYVYDQHPYDYGSVSMDSRRIPAERVIHSYIPGRPSQYQGVSELAANVQTAKDFDWLIGNELTSAALSALLTMVVKRKNGAGTGLGFSGDASSTDGTTDDYDNNIVKWGRGVVADIGAEDDVKIAESSRPNPDVATFGDLLFQLHGMSAGVSHGRVTGQYKGTSYSAARAMHLDDAAYFVVLQSMCAKQFVLPVRRRHTEVCAALGMYSSVSRRQFQNQRHEMLRLIYQAPGREQLDPEKETGAAAERIDAGFSTWQDECGLRGKNWRQVALQQKRERAFFARHGLEYNLRKGSPPADKQQSQNGEGNQVVNTEEAT